MATFKTMVRYKRADGFYQVYIRVLHRSKSGYIKTDKYVTDKQITKSGDIKDAVVNSFCSQEILRYYNPQIQISAESGTKRSNFRQKDKTKRSKKRLHTTLIKPEQKVNEDLCSGFIVS